MNEFYTPNLCAVTYPSAVATFYAPGDQSGPTGMRHEWIRATPCWWKGTACYNCAYVTSNPDQLGFRGLHAVRIRLLFTFLFLGVYYPCALVEWFTPVGDEPDDVTGMWMVQPEIIDDGTRPSKVIHVDTIFRAAHLEPVYDEKFVPRELTPDVSLDAFAAYYINK